jgi:excinuclease ABC subunit C
MAVHDLKGRIARLPEQPGVYLFLNEAGETLYVGKARVLRDRVRTYLGAAGVSPRLDALLREAVAVETIVTDSVVEALALENGLIKQRNPRYNVLLRDDKTYPYLQLTTTEPAPRLLVARRVERDGTVYAGPFMPAALARRTMSLSHRLFGIRSCNEIIDGRRARPCLEYDIKRCLAPCVASICTLERYQAAVAQTRLLIEGRQDELLSGLRAEMADASTTERFERAAHLRDAIRTIETLRDRMQKIETPTLGDRDAIGIKLGPAGAVVQVFQVRRGRVVDRIELMTEGVGPRSAEAGSDPLDTRAAGSDLDAGASGGRGLSPGADPEATEPDTRRLLGEVLEAAFRQVYADRPAPPEVHVPDVLEPAERDAIEAWLSEGAGRAVRLVVPRRGDKRGLLDLAERNASMAYQTHFQEAGAAFEALDELRLVLNLPALPRRIDAFDISTLHGRETVASLVVAVEGRMRRSDYRKYRIRGLGIPGSHSRVRNPGLNSGLEPGPPPRVEADDFAAMHEVVLRRYRRLLDQGGPFPDLILIDGGKGQLTAAYDALRSLGLDRLVAVGLAKQEELLFTRDRAAGLALPRHSAALRLLQRIRDEAHRFAVTFHRSARTRRDLRSGLDDVAGVGPRRRKALLARFGSLAGVRRASRAELQSVVGDKAADAILRHFET